MSDIILTNGRFATLDPKRTSATTVVIRDGRFTHVGNEEEVLTQKEPKTQVIDLQGRTVIPGLNDSHLHVIRAGLHYNMELRWDGVPSVADALRMLKEQVARTPAPQWVRVVGGWSEFQFSERRMPTLKEINAISEEVPSFILHLYDRALLNRAALRAIGYTKDTPAPPGSEIERDGAGNPTGMLIAKPVAVILYAALAKGPLLGYEDQLNSSRQFMRELNRLGLTSVIDAGGGFQNYPDDYKVIEELHKRGEMTLRIAYNLFTQRPKQELEDFTKWTGMTRPGSGDDTLRMNGAGEMLVFTAADYEDFLQPRPDLAPSVEGDLKRVVAHLARERWPFRLHATYEESITRFLNVIEEVDREVPLSGLHWFLDHAETISDRNIERVRALGGGIAVQHRMAYQGEYFLDRYGKAAAERTPPIRRMLELGVPVSAGTDGTRVASYNPWVALYWLVSGKTVGGTSLYPEKNRMSREEALRLYTEGSSWFSSEEGRKGRIVPGQFADLAVLSDDYFKVPEEEIKRLESVLTIMGGKVVWATGPFNRLAPPALPVSPGWSPVATYGGYARSGVTAAMSTGHLTKHAHSHSAHHQGFWSAGCECFAF